MIYSSTDVANRVIRQFWGQHIIQATQCSKSMQGETVTVKQQYQNNSYFSKTAKPQVRWTNVFLHFLRQCGSVGKCKKPFLQLRLFGDCYTHTNLQVLEAESSLFSLSLSSCNIMPAISTL